MSTAVSTYVRPGVALETTLLLHGVPRSESRSLAHHLSAIVSGEGAVPRLVGIVRGHPIVGMTDAQLDELLAAPPELVRKVNASNLGATLFRKQHGATTVSTTVELAAGAGLHVFATGGLGGVHPPLHPDRPGRLHVDVSADLAALAHFPVTVVTSGVKSILDVAATRELLETLGVPVVGFRTDAFPAFYARAAGKDCPGVDARCDDIAELAGFVRFELARRGRGVVVCNPVPEAFEIAGQEWDSLLAQANERVEREGVADGRDATPKLLAALHELSKGKTLRANIALIEDNCRLAARLAVAMQR